ncbi:MAG: response regulator [Candidatus Hodarchaeales archaeon]
MKYGEKILVLIDDEEVVKLLSGIISRIGCKKKLFSNAQEAVEGLKKDKYFLSIVDYKIDGMSDFVFFKEARRVAPELKFIMISDLIDSQMVSEGKKFGLVSCLHRPLDPTVITGRIDNVVKQREEEISDEIELIKGFVEEMTEMFLEAGNLVMAFENDSENTEYIEALFRCYHNLKGGSATVNLNNLARFAHSVENRLKKIMDKEEEITSSLIEDLLNASDYILSLLDALKKDPLNEPEVKGVLDLDEEDVEEEEMTDDKNDSEQVVSPQEEKPPVKEEEKEEKTEKQIRTRRRPSGRAQYIVIKDNLTMENLERIMSSHNFKNGGKYVLSLDFDEIDTAGIQYLLVLKKEEKFDVEIKCMNDKILKNIKLTGTDSFLF